MVDSRSFREPNDAAGILADVDLECVFHARNSSEAQRHRSVLEGFGIMTRLGSEVDGGSSEVNALAGLPLLVPAAEVERASEILARFDIEGAEWDEEDEFEDEEEEEEEEEEEDDDYFPEDDEDEFEEDEEEGPAEDE